MSSTGQTQKSKKFRLSIRWKIALPFILIGVIVIIIFLPIMNSVVSRRIQTEADSRLQEVGGSVAVLINQAENQAVLSAIFVANSSDVLQAGDDTTALSQVLPSRREELGLQELSFYAADYSPGDTARYFGGPLVARPFQSSTEASKIRENLIVSMLATGEPTSDIAIVPQSSEIIGVAPVIAENGGLQGIIVAVYLLDDEFIHEIGAVLNADIALVNANQVIASNLDDPTIYEGYIRDEFLKDLSDYNAQNIKMNGDKRLLAQSLLIDGENRGVIMVAQPIESLTNIQQDIRNVIGSFSALIVIISIVFAVLSYINFARPISQLAEATHRVSEGNFNEYIGLTLPAFVPGDELIDLSHNFNSMTATLNDLYTGLEQRVAERTEELQAERNKLQQTSIELAEARDAALEANRAKSAFMANMSHELRTPLNAIIGYSNLVIAGTYGDINEKQTDRLMRVMDNGQHLLALINDVLDLSKIEAGKMEVYLESFDLSELLETIVRTGHTLMEKNQNQLISELDVDLGQMHSDITKIRQVLFNLLSNAAKFTEKGSVTLRVHAHTDNNREGLLFSVRDTGIGMSADQMDKVFQEFTQADISTTRKYGGTGLGLAITRRFCEMLGGYIALESEEGVGSTFSVWLPRRSEMPKSQTGEVKKIETGTHQPIDNTTSVVLVIDDDDASRETIEAFLQQDHYHVVSTNNGEDGLRLAAEYLPSVILLDVLMPGMDGWAVLHHLKSTPELADIPVIMSTILTDRNMGYTLGASDYITKPVNKEQILRVVKRYRHQMQDSPILLVEDDASTRQMMRDMLETDGWSVYEADNGRAGLESLQNVTPDLILLDLMMPYMNGFEFLKHLRENKNWQSIPVVVITAMDLTPEAKNDLQLSVKHIIQKGSYEQDKLLEEIRYWIQSTRSGIE